MCPWSISHDSFGQRRVASSSCGATSSILPGGMQSSPALTSSRCWESIRNNSRRCRNPDCDQTRNRLDPGGVTALCQLNVSGSDPPTVPLVQSSMRKTTVTAHPRWATSLVMPRWEMTAEVLRIAASQFTCRDWRLIRAAGFPRVDYHVIFYSLEARPLLDGQWTSLFIGLSVQGIGNSSR